MTYLEPNTSELRPSLDSFCYCPVSRQGIILTVILGMVMLHCHRRMDKLISLLPSKARTFAVAISVGTTLLLSSTVASLGSSAAGPASVKHNAAETQKRLKEVEAHRQEVHEHLREAKKKEQIALAALYKIKSKLNDTTKVLNKSKNKLKKTETHLIQCQQTLTQTATQEQTLSSTAAHRLREMYEGQRLGLLESLFQVSSLQQFMDLMYFQERVAELDRQLLTELRIRERALSAQKSQLGNEKMKLGDIVVEFAKKTLLLSKEKTEQEQVADKLRTQRAFYEAAEHQLARESTQLEQQIVLMTKTTKSQDNKPVALGSGNLSLPLKASITSPFGWRRHPIFGIRKFHTGVDLAGANHSPIKAADSGNVLYSGWYGGYGKVVIVSHGKGLATLYAHLSKVNASAGQNITKGDVIGYEGSTGFSTGPHLHFEVRVDGKPNNPLNFLKQ